MERDQIGQVIVVEIQEWHIRLQRFGSLDQQLVHASASVPAR
jgi:hypothetical protein